MLDTNNKGFNTKLIHGGGHHNDFKSATVPIFQTSTFYFDTAEDGAACFAGEKDGYIYTRLGNPTTKALENQVAELEHGYAAIATASGMGAVSTIYMAMLNQGDHMISSAAVYGCSRVLMEQDMSRFGVEASYVHTEDFEQIEKALRPNTKMLFIETPSNPTMAITDIKRCSEFAKKHGLTLVVDNTFCSPYVQTPLDLGADIVFHSVTKFINGHADIVGGIIIAKNEELYKKLNGVMINLGCNMDPHQAYMVIRGLKTLGIRLDRAQESAIKVAEYLKNHPKVASIAYPGLPEHPQYELGKKQMRGFGTMISFELKGGLEAGRKMMNSVQLAILAVSLGGVETLIQHPASMTHAKIAPEDKLKAGITDGLVRFSVGIENVEDIIADLEQALAKV